MSISQIVPVSNVKFRTEDQANSSQQNQYTCSSCSSRTFNTCRGLSQHNRHCTKRINVVSISSSQPGTIFERVEVTNVFSPVTSFVWEERDGTLFAYDLNEACKRIVFWRKSILMLQLETQERNISKKSLDSWTDGHMTCHLDLLAWKQYTQCLRYYYKNQAKRMSKTYVESI